MRNYEFKLTPAYCLYNGIAIKNQQGSRICFLSENPDDVVLRQRVTKAFNNYLEYVNTQEDCPEIYKNHPSIKFVAGNRSELRMQVSQLYSQNGEIPLVENKEEEIKKEAEAAAVVLFDSIMTDARRRNATDIHIENNFVRFRIAGKLETVTKLSEEKCVELIQRIKFLAGMNVLEKRKSQDGHFVYGETEPIFVRVSTVGIVKSKNSGAEESVVIRLLDSARVPLLLPELGFNKMQLSKIADMCKCSNGLIIICGPTGAGKSTTAAALLVELENKCENASKIISLEDPPEYLIQGITQIQIDEKNGNSFSDALMHVFRQDPDVLMIGEIRDESSAAVAIRAALTGHLVIATLHADSAAGVVLRLENLGVPKNLIVSVLKGVIAQELNNFQGNINLVADVALPTTELEKNVEKQFTEDELEKLFEHNANYNQVLAKTIDILKNRQNLESEQEQALPEEQIIKKKNIFIPSASVYPKKIKTEEAV